MKPSDIALIEGFIEERLSQKELAAFKKRLQSDAEFRAGCVGAIDAHALLQTLALEQHDDGTLRETVSVAIGSERPGDLNHQILDVIDARSTAVPVRRKRRHVKHVLLLTLPAWVAAVVILGALYNALPRYGTGVATVVLSSKPISVDRNGERFELGPGEIIRDGDFLMIPEDGAFGFAYEDESSVRLSGGSTVQFSGSETNKRLFVTAGRVEAQISPQKKGTPFTINSPNASAIVLGTKLVFSVRSRSSVLSVEKGSVSLRSRGGESLIVSAGETGVLQAGGVPILIDRVAERAAGVVPTPAQVRWQRLEFAVMITVSPEHLIGPSQIDLDPDQWVRVCKDAGALNVLLNVKNGDGLCLWPSPHTDYSIAQSSWRGGKGDLVAEVADACRRQGLAFGISFSPNDRREATFGSGEPYNQHVGDLLIELCSKYGPLSEIRFPSGGEGQQSYDRDAWFKTVRDLQPEAVISIRGPDARWIGRQDRKAEWSVIPITDPQQAVDWPDRNDPALGNRSQLGMASALVWAPASMDRMLSARPPAEAISAVVNDYERYVGNNARFMLEISPDAKGRIASDARDVLTQAGEHLRLTYARNRVAGAKVRASHTAEPKENHTADSIIDDDPDTYWMTEKWSGPAELIVSLPKATAFDRIVLQEPIRIGQRIEAFAIDAWYDGFWRKIADGSTIGQRKILTTPTIVTNRVRVRFLKVRERAALAELKLCHTPPRPPLIQRAADEKLRMTSVETFKIHYTLDGTIPDGNSARYRTPLPFGHGGQVTARLINDDGTPASAVIRRDLAVSKRLWRLVAASSISESDGEAAEHAFDDDPRSIWHSRYQGGSVAAYPHVIDLDLGAIINISAFGYTPRTDGPNNGIISRLRFESSLDGKNWVSRLSARVPSDNRGRWKLPCATHHARYVRFVALAEINDKDFASVAELDVWSEPKP